MTAEVRGPFGSGTLLTRGTTYPNGRRVDRHRHDRSQLLYGLTGIVRVEGDHGVWIMPPDSALWIPAGEPHEVRMLGHVQMRSLYFLPKALTAMPRHCAVLGLSALLIALIDELVRLGADTASARHALLLDLALMELPRQPTIPLSLPLPADGRLREHCLRFNQRPQITARIEDWCAALNMSRRSFTRHFRAQVGLTFVEWRQRACVLFATARLVAGAQVTQVAFDLGYDNAASFAAMFKRALGVSPGRYRRARAEQPAAAPTA